MSMIMVYYSHRWSLIPVLKANFKVCIQTYTVQFGGYNISRAMQLIQVALFGRRRWPMIMIMMMIHDDDDDDYDDDPWLVWLQIDRYQFSSRCSWNISGSSLMARMMIIALSKEINRKILVFLITLYLHFHHNHCCHCFT